MSVMSDHPNLNSVSNPFASRFTRPGAIDYRDPATGRPIDPAELISRLKSMRMGAIVGDHGTGKSTLLQTLSRFESSERFAYGRWIQLGRDPSLKFCGRIRERYDNSIKTLKTQSEVESDHVLIIDGAEQISAIVRSIVRRRALVRGQMCLITTHRTLRGFPTLARTSINPSVVRTLAAELIANIPDPVIRGAMQNTIESRLQHPVTNVRDLWSDLYDTYESQISD